MIDAGVVASVALGYIIGRAVIGFAKMVFTVLINE